eukprot:TRINITY_DN17513_c0_g1_i1.p2 TRINITY_DN17513_c0_g1~~TRINITY_DN17513_c0_g1_i1.p2  ORF type:complete len:119 (-),score=24.46 TRINITY_DN17513_c0_g1_i1:128-484(-)
MFSQIGSESKKEQQKIKSLKVGQQVVDEEALREFIEETVEDQNKDVEKVFNLQKQIQQNMNELQEEVVNYQQTTQQWVTLLENLEKSLKEFGDFQNFLQALQQQTQEMATKLEQKARE